MPVLLRATTDATIGLSTLDPEKFSPMWEAIQRNRRRSRWLMFLMGLLLTGLGFTIGFYYAPEGGGLIGGGIGMLIWLILSLVAISQGHRVLLRASWARPIEKEDAPQLWNVVEEMTIAAGLPKMPSIYVVDESAPNAFAVGTRQRGAAVAVTTGLLRRLTRDELQGVVAHEIGHLRNDDTKFLTQASLMLGAIVLISEVFLRTVFYTGGRGGRRSRSEGGGQAQLAILAVAVLMAILAPIAARLLYLACSRKREYLADASAARFTRYPAGLASALEKIAPKARMVKRANKIVAPMYIINPLQPLNRGGLWSTHPPVQKRIEVLRAMAGGAGLAAYEAAFRKTQGEKESCLGKRTLADADDVEVRAPSIDSVAGGGEPLTGAREALNLLDRIGELVVLGCSCGMRMKLPSGLKQSELTCPRCGRHHEVPMTVLAGRMAAEAATESTAREPRKPQRYRRKTTGWETFQCACGRNVQLSPKFSASHIACRECGSQIEIVG
jgi:heat shock protein HtpX